jgi:hypothetical protein
MSASARDTEPSPFRAPLTFHQIRSQTGYDIEEGPHSAADVDLLERQGQQDNGLPVRRVLSGLRRLLQDGAIDRTDFHYAERWAADYGLGVLGASNPERTGSSSRRDIHSYRVVCLDAASRYRESAMAVGQLGDLLLRLFAF